MKYTLLIFTGILIFTTSLTHAQLSPGSIAPNWTLTDINGNTHTLYDYLNQGKTVVLDFSATWCAPCWAYHNSGAMETFYEDHGPNGSNESMVFFIEGDISTDMQDLLGLTPQSQGNWVAGTPYPIIDLPDNAVMNAYGINYFPTIYKICPDGYQIYEVGQVPATTFANWIQSCTFEASLNSTTGTTCYGLEEGSATLNVSGGFGNINYQWSNATYSAELQNVEAGTYYATVTEGQGRQIFINEIEISGPLTPIEVSSVSIGDLLCFNDGTGSIEIEANGGNGGFTYQWSNGESGVSIQNLDAGFYSVTILDAEDCDHTEIYFVEEPPILEAELEIVNDHCYQNHGEVIVTPDGGTEPYSLETSGGNIFPGSFTILNLGTGSFLIELTDAHDCIVTEQITIENIEGPEIQMPASPTVSCANGPVVLNPVITNPGGGDLEFAWTTPNGEILSGEDEQACTVFAPGIYTLSIEDLDFGCDIEASILVLGSVDLPTIDAGPDLVLDCSNNFVTPDIFADPLDNIAIEWTTVNGLIVSGMNTTEPVFAAAGTYLVSVVNVTSGCQSSDVVVVTDDRLFPDATFAFDAEELTASFNALQAGATSYHWEFGDGQSSDITNPQHVYGIGGVYHVCLTVTNSCGNETHCIDIVVQSSTSAIQIELAINFVTCYGAQDGSLGAVAIGGSGNYQFEWIAPDGAVYHTMDIADLGPGLYLLTVSDDQGNLTQVQVTMTEPEPLIVSLELTANGGPGIDLTVDGGTQGYTFMWNNGATTEDLILLGSGIYQCTITDANGCIFVTDPIEIINPKDEIPKPRPGPYVQFIGNPAFQPLVIIVDSENLARHSLALFDALGNQINTAEWMGREYEIDLGTYPPGLYFLAVYHQGVLLKTAPLVLTQ